MVFSSTVFLFLFLPFTLIFYYLLPRSSNGLRNVFLFLMSLLFYAWGEPRFVFVMLAIICVNYLLAFPAERARMKGDSRLTRWVVTLTAIVNLSILFVFKYLNFTIYNINLLFHHPVFSQTHIALPIGISFMTFQAMSYVFDVLKGKGKKQSNPLNVGLYVSLFPQLIAGPIVRYQTVSDEIENRSTSLHDFSEGVSRFIVGLGKKVIIANAVAQLADRSFDVPVSELTFTTAWIGAIAYTLQIYYDFSGYSDMAIGLGRMLGFHFLENFDYPYMSRTVTEFWRRWHISLGSWFRDYVYIPLGGSRNGKWRTLYNLFIVWLLTGIWHGANWTFVAWGMLFFFVLCIEKLLGIPQKVQQSFHLFSPWAVYRFLTLLIVICGWVLFRADSIGQALNYLLVMFHFRGLSPSDSFLIAQSSLILSIGILFSVPVIPCLQRVTNRMVPSRAVMIRNVARFLFIFCIGMLSIVTVISSNYNPFIYFNF